MICEKVIDHDSDSFSRQRVKNSQHIYWSLVFYFRRNQTDRASQNPKSLLENLTILSNATKHRYFHCAPLSAPPVELVEEGHELS
jgi:hypothetical protein